MPGASSYSRLDRLTHRLAFRSSILQDTLSDLETRLLAKRWAAFRAERPVFITSLPRAGTTALLEALHRLPPLASHTYRDMPFLLTPVLWNGLSSAFHRRGVKRERAHGDGLHVSADSPEALEEALWKNAFPHKYAGERIALWSPQDIGPPFTGYFKEHMRKIVALRRPDAPREGRYLSKNNANIARIDALRAMFPDASVLVPFRHPVEHAISMWRQHRNFRARHAADPFVKEYMEDIGHYEFGALHKPLAFEWPVEATRGNADSPDYWLAYWIAAFESLAKQEGIDFVGFEALCSAGVVAIETLARRLELPVDAEAVAGAAGILHPPPAPRRDRHAVSASLTTRALATYDALQTRCLLRSRNSARHRSARH